MPRRRNDSDILTQRVGVRAKHFRGGRNIVRISQGANVAPSCVSYLEDGITDVQLGTLERIASSLGVRSTDLLNVDPDNDLGAIYEMMRENPDMVAKLIGKLKGTST